MSAPAIAVDVAAERARVLEARRPKEERTRRVMRAHHLLRGRWNATEEELRGEIATEYDELSAREVEALLAVVLEVQRSDRPRIDPSTVRVRYPEPEAKKPSPASKNAVEKADMAELADRAGKGPGRKKRRPLERPPREEKPMMDAPKAYDGRRPGHRAIATRVLAELDGPVTPARLVVAMEEHGLAMDEKQAVSYLARNARRAEAPEPTPAAVEPAPPPPPTRIVPPVPPRALTAAQTEAQSRLEIPPPPRISAPISTLDGGGIAIAPVRYRPGHVRLWIDIEVPIGAAGELATQVITALEEL